MHEAHHISDLSIAGMHLHMTVDGRAWDIDLSKESSLLAKATQAQRERVEISPSGYGLHWPELDEDLSVDGLIGVRHEAPLVVAETRGAYCVAKKREGKGRGI